MASKMVSELHKLGARVTAATSDRSRNDRAMQGLLARCADVVPEGVTSATVEEAQFYLGQQIAFEAEALRFHDDNHVDRLVDVDGERSVRDDALTETYDMVLQTRRAFEIVHGPGSGTRLLGLDTTVPEDPQRLFQMADRCRRWLRDPERVLPEARLKAFRFDREQSAADMDGPVDRLGQALRTLPEELKGSVDTLAGKFAAMRRLDRLVGQAARFTEALYDVSGMEFESDRVRLSSHRTANANGSAQASPPAAGPSPKGDGEGREASPGEAPAPEGPAGDASPPEGPSGDAPPADAPAGDAPAGDSPAR